MRLSHGPSSISARLAVLIGGLSLLTGLACFTFAYLQVRRVTMEAAGERLQSAAFQLESQLRMQVRALERRARTVRADPVLRAWAAEPTALREASALAALRSLQERDNLGISWQLISMDGDTLTAGAPPSLRAHIEELARRAAVRPDSAAVGELHALDTNLVYPVLILLPGDGRRPAALLHWRRSTLSRRTGIQLRSLVGEGARLVLGTPGRGWTTLRGLTREPVFPPEWQREAFLNRDGTLGRRFTVARTVGDTPWVVALDLPLSVVRAPVSRFSDLMLVALAALAGTALLVALLQSRRLTRPIRDLLGATQAMIGDDYSRRVVVKGADELAQLAVAFNAMAERVEDEVLARRVSEEQWRVLFASNPFPMWVYDRATLRFLAVNRSAVECYGYSQDEFLAMTILDIRPPEDVPTLKERLARAGPSDDLSGTYRHRAKGGAIVEMEVRSRAITFAGHAARLVLAQDVTQRVQLEAELRQAQKMEAIGRLAAGVAHDFNNALAVIMTHGEMLHEALPDGDARRQHTDEVMAAARSAHGLTRQLLAFSRQQVVRPQPLALNNLIRAIERLIRPLVGARVTLVLDLGSSRECAVVADPAQMEQVLLNLVMNARDAMPMGGTLRIGARCETLDEAAAERLSLSPGEYGVVTVTDTGIGMSAEVRSRIFEPFFTTKGEGKGTGLGLPSVYGIVKQAGGSVKVESEPDQGATFTIYLPRTTMPVSEAGPVEERAAARSARPGGHETILLAEDEPAVRDVITSILKRLGYRLIIAADAREALELAEKSQGSIHLLVSDVVMPGMTGPALLEKLRHTHPGLRALFISGYAGESVRDHGLSDPSVPFLEKPFTMQSLAAKVRQALG